MHVASSTDKFPTVWIKRKPRDLGCTLFYKHVWRKMKNFSQALSDTVPADPTCNWIMVPANTFWVHLLQLCAKIAASQMTNLTFAKVIKYVLFKNKTWLQ